MHIRKTSRINTDGRRLYVSDYQGSVSVINIADYRVGVIRGACRALEVVTADGSVIYAAHNANDHCASWVSVVSTDVSTVVATAGFDGYAVTDLAVNPDGTRVYVALARHSSYYRYAAGLVAVIDAAVCAVIGAIDLPMSPDTITVSPDGSMMYATHYDTEAVSAIDLVTHSIMPIALADNPLELTLTPDGLQAYVVSRSSLSVADTVTNEPARITGGDLPRCVQISPDGKRAYVSNFGDHTVSVIDTVTQCVSNTIDVGGYPETLALSPDGQRLYVGHYWSGIVTVIATSSCAGGAAWRPVPIMGGAASSSRPSGATSSPSPSAVTGIRTLWPASPPSRLLGAHLRASCTLASSDASCGAVVAPICSTPLRCARGLSSRQVVGPADALSACPDSLMWRCAAFPTDLQIKPGQPRQNAGHHPDHRIRSVDTLTVESKG